METLGQYVGVMGIADMLIKMGVAYGSDESLDICHSVVYTIFNSAVYASASLAAMNDRTFPKYDYEALCKSPMYQQCVSDTNKKYVREHGMYNSQLLTIAPTGTLSTMLGISGGIEPIFANYYTRKTESLHGEDVYYKVYTPIVKHYMEANELESDEQLPEFFVTARDIPYEQRLAMQRTWQLYIDASISSTINLPESATMEDVEDIYIKAWEYGLKGVTVFRENCRRAGVLTTEKKEEELATINDIPRGYIIPAGDNLIGKKRKLTTGCGSLHCTAFFDPETGNLMETYLSRGSTGGCANSYTGLSRMISLAARGGVPLEAIVDQLNSCGICPSYAVRRATKKDTSAGACCPIAVGKALVEMHDEMMNELWKEAVSEVKEEMKKTDPGIALAMEPESDAELQSMAKLLKVLNRCPECGDPLTHEGGCDICKNCGWSKCT